MKLDMTSKLNPAVTIRCLLLALTAVTSVAASAQDGIKVYRVPKEQPPRAANQTPAGLVPVSESVLPALTYTTPAGWTELPAGQMRVASFKVQADGKTADVSVIPLPGTAGGDLSNINRWRGQVGLEPVSAAELAKAAQKISLAGEPAVWHEMAGTNVSAGEPTRILGAIQHRDGMAWFFKMTGDDALVEKNRAAFLDFLKSVKFTSPKPPALPADHPPIGDAQVTSSTTGSGNPASAPSSDSKPKWTVPSGWKEVAGGQFLVAKFTLAGESGAAAAVNVSASAGDGGGLAANVNRWRGQLGQSPWSEPELKQQVKAVNSGGHQIQFVEMSGKDVRSGQPNALVGAMVTHRGMSWFYKLMGDPQVVAAQKDTFTSFVKGVSY